ncbi:MAG: hypothetical protein IRZ16_07005 [Myxococcaceae bacterium]|nr:hypothetical protein [Myxococcaceae bacterium]
MKTAIQALILITSGVVFTGCGNPALRYVGLYSGTGTMTMSFDSSSGQQSGTRQLAGNVNLREGVSSDLVYDDSECQIPFNMDDADSASLVPGASCTGSADGATATLTYTNGFIRFDEKIVTVTLNATVTVTKNGATVVGTMTEDLTLTRLTK